MIIRQGKITDIGVTNGGSVSFYVLGEKIQKIRFSCKNQWISGIDATEKRESYGYSENFTFEYGSNEEDYKFINLYWEPRQLCDRLRDDHNLSLSDLSEEERSDIIVMQITFLNKKETTMAMWIHIDTEGYISASVGTYQVTSADTFVLQDDISTPYHSPEWWSEHYINDNAEIKAADWGITSDNPLYSKFTDEQLARIISTLQDYYAGIKRKIIKAERYTGGQNIDNWYEGYEWKEVIFFKVMVEDDFADVPRYIAIGSKDNWNECTVLNEGY